MLFVSYYSSPLGEIVLEAENGFITGLWLPGQRAKKPAASSESEPAVIAEAKRWLDTYFSGKKTDLPPPVAFHGTAFQKEVWSILLTIPYGKTLTYGKIAEKIAEERGILRMSAQAVGNAVGSNPISIIVPCHRVMGSGGNLTGYAGGIDYKIALLKIEGAYSPDFRAPKKKKPD